MHMRTVTTFLRQQSAVVASGESVGPRSQPPAAVTIEPSNISRANSEIKTGTTVTWVNQDDIRHTVTLGTPERLENVSLNFPAKGATASYTFDCPGVYEYFCDRHPSMRGQIHVQ